MSANYGQVSVGTIPTLIVAANNSRRGLMLDNQGSASVFIGPDSSITISNAVSIRTGTALVFDDHFIRTAIYGVVASGTATVGWWETNE